MWPTPASDVAVPAFTPPAPRPVNGYPTNGAAGKALLPPPIEGRPVPVWPPEPAGEPLPPSAVFAGAPSLDDSSVSGVAMASLPGLSDSPDAMSQTASASTRRLSRPKLPRFGKFQLELPNNLAASLVAAGSGVALVAMLLPWSDNVVGAKHFGGYTDSWGLAVPSHFIVVALLIAVLALAVMPNPVPSWLRTGVLGVLFGGLLIGLVWPYFLGDFSAGLGVIGEAIGAVLLCVGGILDRRATRHASLPTSV
jgi:hypothetical protein